ncbi:hypothetical protein, partial [Phocoenobacter skyensis]|uniref:hypothetical protein n=1 Tax=Phocoenobacter skyensis TaxID=97481 RepID=UPI002745C2E1
MSHQKTPLAEPVEALGVYTPNSFCKHFILHHKKTPLPNERGECCGGQVLLRERTSNPQVVLNHHLLGWTGRENSSSALCYITIGSQHR